MIKRIASLLAAAVLALAAFAPAPVSAQQTAKVVASCGSASYTAGTTNYQTVDTTGAQCGNSSGGGGATTSNGTTSTTTSTSALAANLIVTATASKRLANFQVSADSTLSAAAWWVMIYNATTAPADGAITPVACIAVPIATTSMSADFGPNSPTFSTGIVIGVSTTGCFTKTASTHAFISGNFF